ncbi:MAG: glutaconyl-CoA decarboxylase subunit beta [Anaerolineae bacterium]|nr:sodium ion-translocating decarboxylase subunit beta [Anaerolineales bacterium]MCQ3974435.1 glutaconyl-CoA decarboxylase subunit beta [Anaerolineae bacterium]
MILVGFFFMYLAITKDYEPLLLVPIGFGIVVGNMPFVKGLQIGIYEQGSSLNYLYFGVIKGIYPPLIFLGIGAMTDFSALIAQPRLILLGAAAQMGIFITLLGVILIGTLVPGGMGFPIDPANPETDPATRLLRAAASVGIIGGADGPTAIFLSTRLAPDLLGAIAVSAYSYMALVPVIQPPIMRLLTSREERLIRMPPPPTPSHVQRILFPIIGMIICVLIAPGALSLLAFLFFGNILKECGVTERLARTARNPFIDTVTILLGLTVGASTQADTFLKPQSIAIFVLGAFSFGIATASGVMFAKLMNLLSKDKINPLIGSAGVSAVPDSARVSQLVAHEEDPNNFVLMQAMGPNVAGVIGSAVAAGVLLAVVGKL